jgi:branched-chain amino acid transport system substrate-binding protein
MCSTITFYGGGLGTPAAIGEAGVGILNQVTEWHSGLSVEENQPEDEKFYLGYHEKYSNNGENSYYYGRIRTTMEMLAKAIDKAGSTNAKAIAHALAGMTHETYYGTVTMRAEDHQLIQPLYISVFTPGRHRRCQIRRRQYRHRLEDKGEDPG